MDKKSKILLATFFILFIISLFFTYYRTMVVRDYEVINSNEDENSSIEENIEIDTTTNVPVDLSDGEIEINQESPASIQND